MTIPTYPAVMRPFLEYLADANREVRLSDICEELRKRECFPRMTKEEFENDRTNSGQLKFVNRVGWAAFELKKAKLTTSRRFAYHQITERGRDAVAKKEDINPKFLMRYPEFKEYREGLKAGTKSPNTESPNQENLDDETGSQDDLETPEDKVEDARNKIKKIKGDLEERVKAWILASMLEVSPTRFEEIAIDLLVAMGYGDGEALGKVRDRGIDGVINQDTLGVDKVYVQAKKFNEASVSAPMVRDFCGALDQKGVNKGILVTTSSFTLDAEKAAQGMKKNIILINGDKLAELMIRHNIGCIAEKFEVKTADEKYFE